MPSRDDVEVDCDDCDEPRSSENDTFSSIGDGRPRLMISLCSSSSELIECFCRMSGPVRDRAISGLGQSLKLVCCSEGISPTVRRRYNVSFPPGSSWRRVCMCVCQPLFQDQTRVLFDNSLSRSCSVTLSISLSLAFCNTCVFNDDDDDESLKLSEIFWCKIATSSLRDSRGLEAL